MFSGNYNVKQRVQELSGRVSNLKSNQDATNARLWQTRLDNEKYKAEVDKLKAIVAELTDYVYSEKSNKGNK